MGKPTGFLEYERETSTAVSPLERIKNFNEFHTPLSQEEQQIQQGLAQCGQNALRGICAYVLHTNTSFPHKDNIPAPHRPPTSGCTGPKRRNLKLSECRKEGRTPHSPLRLVSCDQIFTSHCILITALPPTRTVTASPAAYRRLRISEGRFMCSPCRKTFSCPGCTMPRRYR